MSMEPETVQYMAVAKQSLAFCKPRLFHLERSVQGKNKDPEYRS